MFQKRFNPRQHKRFDRHHNDHSNKIYIYGKHALEEAVAKAPHAIKKVFLSAAAENNDLRSALAQRGITASSMKARDISQMVGRETAHQGVIALIDPAYLMVDFRDFLAGLKPNTDTMLVLLDELTDPQNVGAIIRSAAAFGAAGVLIPPHHQAPITGAVVKVSAGMVFSVPLVAIGNVNQTVLTLKEHGFRTYGLDMAGTRDLREEKFDSPSLIIIGNEGEGIRQKTLEHCDVTLRIPMSPNCESLNASVSAAVVLYEWSKHHLQNEK
jgi:23S rRNA (guanosine2251-2'-O)-methyltransferase